jgi:hypothetical protein
MKEVATPEIAKIINSDQFINEIGDATAALRCSQLERRLHRLFPQCGSYPTRYRCGQRGSEVTGWNMTALLNRPPEQDVPCRMSIKTIRRSFCIISRSTRFSEVSLIMAWSDLSGITLVSKAPTYGTRSMTFKKRQCSQIQKYNGCIIADSAGLGKTFEALAVIKYFEQEHLDKVLVLTPVKLYDNWASFRNMNVYKDGIIRDSFNYRKRY